MKHIGIDLGSRYVKIIIYDDIRKDFTYQLIDTIKFYRTYIKRDNDILSIDIESLFGDNDVTITATGYGRNLLEFSNAEIISEIKAHFRGALKSSSVDHFTLIDIGGQDSKVILAKDGYIEDFIMNDKCAASTGRFLEQSATVLGITVNELSEMKTDPADISVTCAVFAESEIISLLATGKKIENIAAGINLSIAKRLATLLKSRMSENIFASGGVADNKALIFYLSELIGNEVKVLPNSQYNGANGCIKY